jgi:hypothetical protein
LDVERLAASYRSAAPTRFFCIDGFLDDAFAREVAAAYPDYESAAGMGREFMALHERLKVQVSDAARFPGPVRALHEALSSPTFLAAMERITGIEELIADAELGGGGMHVMGAGGRLDVHVDFNVIRDRGLHRRLNILVFLNQGWQPKWGGDFELWNPGVTRCLYSLAPIANRCVVFNTTETSFHGVAPVRCPRGVIRRSFAAYYYTEKPPVEGQGPFHSTLFRQRPTEWWRGALLAPAERFARASLGRLRGALRRRAAGE